MNAVSDPPIVLFRLSRVLALTSWLVILVCLLLSADGGTYGKRLWADLAVCAGYGVIAGLFACRLRIDLRAATDRVVLNNWLRTTRIPLDSVVAVQGDQGLYVETTDGKYRSSVFLRSMMNAAAGYPRAVAGAKILSDWIDRNGRAAPSGGRPRRQLRVGAIVLLLAGVAASEIAFLLVRSVAAG